jgi:hypothetical protein
MIMIYQPDDQHHAEQLRALQVGEAVRQQPYTREDAASSGAELDQLVERVRWLMRREPMLEREMQPI